MYNIRIEYIMRRMMILTALSVISMVGYSASIDDVDDVRNEKLTDIETIEKVELRDCSDPELDWSQYDEKYGKALVTKKGFELKSEKGGTYCMTYFEADNLNVESEDFIVRFVMTPKKISDNNPFGIVYDVENEDNYKVLLLFGKKFQRIKMSNGKAIVEKKDIYKLTSKSKTVEVDLVYEKGKLYFFINKLELNVLKNPVLKNPTFGFIVGPKSKMMCDKIGLKKFARPESNEMTDTI